MQKVITLFIFYIVFSTSVVAQTFGVSYSPFMSDTMPKREVRAVWLTTVKNLDWPKTYSKNTASTIAQQKKELTDILDQLQKAGINTVLFQSRVRATTIYPSKYEPWDVCLTGKGGVSPGYDPLQFAIDECHKRGMEIHAWVVTIPCGPWNSAGCAAMRKKYPSLVKKNGEDGYLDPANAQTGDVIAQVCEEITRNYDIDGIHLDYMRYPETVKLTVSKEKGRQNITNIVRKINLRVKAVKPWVKMSCSPLGKFHDLPRQKSGGWNGYNAVCQDAQGWMKAGLMDQLYPMMYHKDNYFFPFALDWNENSNGRMVIPGLGIYFLDPKEGNWKLKDIKQQMNICRQWDMGHCYFRSKFFTRNCKGIYTFAEKEFDNVPSLVPPLTWESDKLPTAPTTLVTDSVNGQLRWSGAKDCSDGDYLTYNIYCSRQFPVDVANANNLVAPRLMQTALQVPLDGHYYAVTAMDRYGNESEAKQMFETGKAPRRILKVTPCDSQPIFDCDGKMLKLGKQPVNKSDIIEIQTLQGSTLQSTFFAENIDISKLPCGFYLVRSVGRKSNHRLGFFEIKR